MLNSLIIFCVVFGSGNLVAANGPAATIHPASLILPSAYAADTPTTYLDQLKAEYGQLNAQYDVELKQLSDLQNNGAPQSDIDKQISLLQDIQNQRNANLDKQYAEVKKGAFLGGSNSVVNNPQNSVVNNPQQLLGGSNSVFRHWDNPFSFR
jgi:hypothetical protein